MSGAPQIIDRDAVRRNRTRAAAEFLDYDFLVQRVADDLVERLDDVTRRFARVLDLGSHTGALGERLVARPGVQQLVSCDLSREMVRRASGLAVVGDEEALPFADGAFDLVVSCLSLHWVNDLPGTLVQVRRSLAPDSLFIASFLGGATLTELRQCWLAAEAEVEGGASPRVLPFADVRDAGDLLARTGFKLPVAVSEKEVVSYESPLKLVQDLRGMGEANAHTARRKTFTRRETLARALGLYIERFADESGRVPATFEIVTLTGWTPPA